MIRGRRGSRQPPHAQLPPFRPEESYPRLPTVRLALAIFQLLGATESEAGQAMSLIMGEPILSNPQAIIDRLQAALNTVRGGV